MLKRIYKILFAECSRHDWLILLHISGYFLYRKRVRGKRISRPKPCHSHLQLYSRKRSDARNGRCHKIRRIKKSKQCEACQSCVYRYDFTGSRNFYYLFSFWCVFFRTGNTYAESRYGGLSNEQNLFADDPAFCSYVYAE